MAVRFPHKSKAQIEKNFLNNYQSFFNQAQLSAQKDNHDLKFFFFKRKIEFVDQKGNQHLLNIPKEFIGPNEEIIIKANGYVAPTKIKFVDLQGKKRFTLIYSLGFGNYRVEKYE
ncbi:type II secretion protein [Oenococcus sp. UCMA 16435]|nr:type II secretion protein [Oenococcus sp. UCMA 16435]MDI4584832.1 type II secretion protein [Oenococcus sp. UCMA 14587]MDN6967595.1 type II secretion protein [Oenococcus sp. UCMA 17063]